MNGTSTNYILSINVSNFGIGVLSTNSMVFDKLPNTRRTLGGKDEKGQSWIGALPI